MSMKNILIIIISIIAIWALFAGTGSLLLLFGAYAYLFIMKHGR